MEVKGWKGKYQGHSTLISPRSQEGPSWDTRALAHRSGKPESVFSRHRFEVLIACQIRQIKGLDNYSK
jgi:hypothetical protein